MQVNDRREKFYFIFSYQKTKIIRLRDRHKHKAALVMLIDRSEFYSMFLR
jgi:hypothetical protein